MTYPGILTDFFTFMCTLNVFLLQDTLMKVTVSTETCWCTTIICDWLSTFINVYFSVHHICTECRHRLSHFYAFSLSTSPAGSAKCRTVFLNRRSLPGTGTGIYCIGQREILLELIANLLTCKSVCTVPSPYINTIYHAAVSQVFRNSRAEAL